MSVTLTLALPDLRPDTICAAFDALLPPEPAEPAAPAEAPPGLVEFTPSGEPVFLIDGDETAAPAEPEPEPEHALIAAARVAVAMETSGIETSISMSYKGPALIRVCERDFRRLFGGLTAGVSYGTWTVSLHGVEWVCWLGTTSESEAVVPPLEPPAADVPDDAPPAADDVVF